MTTTNHRHDRSGRVLVVIEQDDRPHDALLRGFQIAQACDAELEVLRVQGAARPLSWMLFPHRYAADLTGSIVRDLEALASGAAWCDEVLPEPLGQRYLIRRGRLLHEVAAEVRRVPTRLVVLTAEGLDARRVVELTNDLQVPVLLARPRTAGAVVVAATDLRANYPVLHEAAEVAPALAARLLCLHNRTPHLPLMTPLGELDASAYPIVVEHVYDDAQALRSAAGTIAADADTVVTSQTRAEDAILDVARAEDADLIVIGAARTDSLHRWLTGSTAAAVIRRAKRSVLLTPLARDARRRDAS